MKKALLVVLVVLAATCGVAQTTTTPVPVVIKDADKPKPSKKDMGIHVMVPCNFYVVGDGISSQITVNVPSWPSKCLEHPVPFSAPDTADSLIQNVYFYAPAGAIGPYTVPVSYDANGNFTFTFPVTPPANVPLALSFNIYYSH